MQGQGQLTVQRTSRWLKARAELTVKEPADCFIHNHSKSAHSSVATSVMMLCSSNTEGYKEFAVRFDKHKLLESLGHRQNDSNSLIWVVELRSRFVVTNAITVIRTTIP